jgi:hypothetical protein
MRDKELDRQIADVVRTSEDLKALVREAHGASKTIQRDLKEIRRRIPEEVSTAAAEALEARLHDELSAKLDALVADLAAELRARLGL